MPKSRAFLPVLCAGLVLVSLSAARAQSGSASSPGSVPERLQMLGNDASSLLNNLFGQSERAPRRRAPRTVAQASGSDLVVRLDRLENQIRQLTGIIEQLQYRNQQLEQNLRRLQEDIEYRFQEQAGRGGGRPPQRPAHPGGETARAAPAPSAPPPPPPAETRRRPDASEPAGGRRSDAFDPDADPQAPGAPRTLGAMPGRGGAGPGGAGPGGAGPGGAGGGDDPQVIEAPVGAPGGRRAGAPLDLSTLSARAVDDPTLAPGATGTLPPPPPRNPSRTGNQQATLPPSASPKDEFDLAYGYVLHKDYALAEAGFRAFVKEHPSDRLVPDAHYWLGESLYQRQRYRDAAESFLTVSTTFEKSSKAPDALLRLGQSLAALKEKEAACATFVEVGRKYPRAPASVRQSVAAEQKRVRC